MKIHLTGGIVVERNVPAKPVAEAQPAPAKRGRKPKAEKVEEPKVEDSEPQSED